MLSSIFRVFVIAFCLLLSNTPLRVYAQIGFGEARNINNDWRFKKGDIKDAADTAINDSRWQRVDLPHDWSVKGQLSPTLASATGYLPAGVAWYRKKINISTDAKGKKIFLYFEGIYNRSEVFLNGHSLGKRPNGYISFSYDATPYINFGSENTLAIRVDHSRSADSRWYTGSGIYRDVWVITADNTHFSQWGVFAYPKLNKEQGLLNIESSITSPQAEKLRLQAELFDSNGKLVAKSSRNIEVKAGESTTSLALKVSHPQRWSLEKPTLYTLNTKLYRGNTQIDQNSLQTGFRSLSFNADHGFALNGQSIKVKGVCLHHDSGVLGAEFYEEVWRRRLLNLKALGCNAIRTSHNPQASTLYKLCDELGLLVMNEAFDEWEFPKRKWLEGWNVGTPGFEGSYDFFKEWGEKDLADMVKRDRNHISIFAWSIGNEVDYPNDPYSHPVLEGSREGGFTQPVYGGYRKDAPDASRLGTIAKTLATVVRQYDKTRPVTAGLAGVVMSNATEYPTALDIAGYNYTESRYITDHKQYPDRVIYGSENRHDYAAWKAVLDHKHIFGQFLWTGIDYLGESGSWPSRGFYSGLLDFGGVIKPRGHFRQALWSTQPVAYLGTYPAPGNSNTNLSNDVWSQLEAGNTDRNKNQPPSMDAWNIWNYTAGQPVRVVCYTNASSCRLFLNGSAIGDSKSRDPQTGMIYWDLPYVPGKLEVIGSNTQGAEVCRYAISTTKRPYALKAQLIDTNVKAQGGIAQIIVQVVDEDGLPVMLSQDEVTCFLNGPGTLAGLEAGDNTDMGDYTDNKQRVYHGKLIAYIKTHGAKGETIKVKFAAPWLQGAQTTVDLIE